jgi:hypothetical protein
MRPSVTGGAVTYDGPKVIFSAKQPRRSTTSHLRVPEVVAEAVEPTSFGGPRVKLTAPRSKNPPVRSKLPKVIGAPPAAVVYSGPSTPFAPQRRGKPRSFYIKPTVQFVEYFTGPVVKLATPRATRPGVHSKLPQVVPTVVVAEVYYGPRTHLVRLAPPRYHSALRPPVVVYPPITFGGPVITLAASFRGKPKSVLHAPADLVDDADKGQIRVTLAPSYGPKAVAKSHLSPPAVVAPVLARGIQTLLTPGRAGQPKSHLAPPTVVSPFFARKTQVSLARIRPFPTTAFLRPPADLVDRDDLGQIKVTLAPSHGPKTMSELRPPVVIGPVLARPIVIKLARITHPPVQHVLGKPADTVGLEDQGRVKVTLARITHPPVESFLSPPTVIDLRPQVYVVDVHLAPSFRGKPKSRLSPPSVLRGAIEIYGPELHLTRIRPVKTIARLEPPVVIDLSPQTKYLTVWLTYSRRGKPTSFLSPPTDTQGLEDQGKVAVHLAYQSRGKPKSRLAPPAVVAPVLARPVVTKLARITPPPTLSKLRPPVVTFNRVDDAVADITLVKNFPPPVHSILRKPVVIDLRPQVYEVDVNLTYSRRGRPMYLLGEPSRFAPTPKAETVLSVNLAYSLRGKPKSKLRPPVVIDNRPQTVYPNVNLTRNKVKRTRYFLRPPAVVITPTNARPIEVALTRIRPPRTTSFSTGVIYGAKVYAPITVTLAPQRRGVPKSKLSPPAVVTVIERPTYPISVTLAPSFRGRPTYFIAPPTVIDDSPQVFTLRVKLVRIRPPKTHWFLRPPTVVTEECFGAAVCGFDFAAEVCGVDAGAIAQGTVTASEVHGSDSGATVTGASAPGGSVTGGDERREGC